MSFQEENGTLNGLLGQMIAWIEALSTSHSTGVTVTIHIDPLSVYRLPWTSLRAHYHLDHDEIGVQRWFVHVAEDTGPSDDEEDGGLSWSMEYWDPTADV